MTIGPGNWYIHLDDGSDAKRHTEIRGAVRLEPGEKLVGSLDRRRWRIDRVDPDLRWAVAVPDDQAEPPAA